MPVNTIRNLLFLFVGINVSQVDKVQVIFTDFTDLIETREIKLCRNSEFKHESRFKINDCRYFHHLRQVISSICSILKES